MNEAAATLFPDDFQIQICPSLKNIATFKILTAMWNHLLLKAMLEGKRISYEETKAYQRKPNPYISWKNDKLKADKSIIENNIKKLKLPKSLQNELMYFNGFIGKQIDEWKDFFMIIAPGKRNYYTTLKWTGLGTLDKIKTARKIIEDENEPLGVKYVISCCFCFKSDIIRVWQNLDYSSKFSFLNSNIYLVRMWSSDMDEGEYTFEPELAFRKSVQTNNEIGAKFFFDLLDPKFREEVVLESVKNFENVVWYKDLFSKFPQCQESDIIYYLFSKMSNEQKLEVLKVKYKLIGKSFLCWPWCINLTKFLNMLWDFCEKDIFFKVIDFIPRENFSLFEDFWQESCFDVRKEVVQWFVKSFSLSEIIRKSRDIDMVKVFLKSVDSSIVLARLSNNLSYFNDHICDKDEKWESYFVLVKNEISSLLECKRNQISLMSVKF